MTLPFGLLGIPNINQIPYGLHFILSSCLASDCVLCSIAGTPQVKHWRKHLNSIPFNTTCFGPRMEMLLLFWQFWSLLCRKKRTWNGNRKSFEWSSPVAYSRTCVLAHNHISVFRHCIWHLIWNSIWHIPGTPSGGFFGICSDILPYICTFYLALPCIWVLSTSCYHIS